MIISAKNKKLNNFNSNLPNMANTIQDWFLSISFDIIERTRQGVDWIEGSSTTVNTMGVVQPPRDKDLEILPMGTWQWEWLLIHCLPDVQLENNQYIRYSGKKYKVMAKKDFTQYGYVRYTVLEAYRADTL